MPRIAALRLTARRPSTLQQRAGAAAIAAVTRLRARGIRNIDVGCMQVNLHYHGQHFETLALIGLLENRIVHWSLYGQVSPTEAADLLAKSVSLSQMVDEMAEPHVVH